MKLPDILTGGSRQVETFTLDEGAVSVSIPPDLSAESLDDFKRHLEILTARLERRVKRSS